MVPHNLPSMYPWSAGNSPASMNGKGHEVFAIITAKRRSTKPAVEEEEDLRDRDRASKRRSQRVIYRVTPDQQMNLPQGQSNRL